MLSHIQMNSGRVAVYGVGKVFESLEWGMQHAYEGTIAQDVERFGLHSLMVEDTLDSVKSIDWALFAPQGVPFLFRKTVLFGTRSARRADPDQPKSKRL